jgi:hypothetical protein
MAFRINNKQNRLLSNNGRLRPINKPLPARSIQEKGIFPKNTTNTHDYDGKLNVHLLVQSIQEQQKDISPALITEKIYLFTRLIEDLKLNPNLANKYRMTAIQAVNIISRSIRQQANFDASNGLFADDVLYIVCKKIEKSRNSDALIYLAEQLSDIITSGQCAQGRSTRIFQVLYTMDNYPEQS